MLSFGSMMVVLIIFNMDEHTMVSKVNMIHNICINYTSFVDIKPTYKQIFEDELTVLDNLAHFNPMYGDTSAGVPITSE